MIFQLVTAGLNRAMRLSDTHHLETCSSNTGVVITVDQRGTNRTFEDDLQDMNGAM